MTREDYRFCNLPMFIARTHKSNLLKENKIFNAMSYIVRNNIIIP